MGFYLYFKAISYKLSKNAVLEYGTHHFFDTLTVKGRAADVISRTIETWARKNTGWFPVVSITGPRQSGKSTLVRSAFPEYAYVNLEDATARQMALDDPVGFIRNRPRRLAVDDLAVLVLVV